MCSPIPSLNEMDFTSIATPFKAVPGEFGMTPDTAVQDLVRDQIF